MAQLIDRRSLLWGLVATPAVIRTPGLLMPIKPDDMIELEVTVDLRYINDTIKALGDQFVEPFYFYNSADPSKPHGPVYISLADGSVRAWPAI